MAQKKITIKDVAREAGVSVATVSYVMNRRTDIKISEETRKKVLQVANLLNYTPNLAAKALASSQQHLLGITYEKTEDPFMKAQQMIALETFLSFFRQKGYDLILVDADSSAQYDQVDALICYNVSSEHFHALGDQNFVPLLAFDCYINDSLFFQITTDYHRLQAEAANAFSGQDYTYLLLPPANQELSDEIAKTFSSVAFYSDKAADLLHSNQPLLITDPVVKSILGDRPNTYYASSFFTEKLELLNRALDSAIQRQPMEEHNLTL